MTDTHEPISSPAADGVEAARKRFTAAYNLAGWDGDWVYAAYAATQLIAAQEARIRALEAGMVDCYLITLQLTVQSRISAAQPGSNISARILEALGADALTALVDAVPVERRRQLAEGDTALEAALTAEQAARARAEAQVDAAYKKGYDDAREDFQRDAERDGGKGAEGL